MSIVMNLEVAYWIFALSVLVMMLIRWPYAIRRRRVQIIESQIDAQEKGLLVLVSLGMMVLPLLLMVWPAATALNWPFNPLLALAGAMVMVLSLWIFWCSHSGLGANWSASLELCQHQQLIKTGVYRHLRHPMYASIWLWGIAQAMLLQNWLFGLSGIVSFALMYFLRVPQEERMMLKQFGADYQRYMQQTGRVLPKWQME